MLEKDYEQTELVVLLLDRLVEKRAEELCKEHYKWEAIDQVYGQLHMEERCGAEKALGEQNKAHADEYRKMADLLLRIPYGKAALSKRDVETFDKLITFYVDDFSRLRDEETARIRALKLVNSDENFSKAQDSDNIYLETRQELGEKEQYFRAGVSWLSSLKLELESSEE